MLNHSKILTLILAMTISAIISGCVSRRASRELTSVDMAKNVNPRMLYLKVHLQNGDLYVLHSWEINEQARTIQGLGNHLDFNRKIIESKGSYTNNMVKAKAGLTPLFVIPFGEVVILETNDKGTNPGVAAMVVAGLATVPVSIICLLNPKACFGSCPTYYVQRDTASILVAEGFSSSISKSLEETDVDLIDFKMNEGKPLQITMKNEALETHLVNSVNIIAIGKSPGTRILQNSDGGFYQLSHIQEPSLAKHNSKSVLAQIAARDTLEWYSFSDSVDLLKKEDIILDFENPGEGIGLIINKRQSLLTTYLFYQSLALTGNSTAMLMTDMETRKPWLKNRVTKLYDLLGGIDVFIKETNGTWKFVSTVREAGPIVSDVHLIKLPEIKSKKVHVRLRMTKGLWRINAENLSVIDKKVIPCTLSPIAVFAKNMKNEEALTKLLDTTTYLVTYPGDKSDVAVDSKETILRQYLRDVWIKFRNFADQERGEVGKIRFRLFKLFLVGLKPIAVVVFVQIFEEIQRFFGYHNSAFAVDVLETNATTIPISTVPIESRIICLTTSVPGIG